MNSLEILSQAIKKSGRTTTNREPGIIYFCATYGTILAPLDSTLLDA